MPTSSEIAIQTFGLGKRYTLGGKQEKYQTLRETIRNVARAPWRSFRRKKQLPAETIWSLREVDLTINAGEVVGVIGRNGAGKSTLLKVLSRITEPTEGYAEVHGRVGSLLEVGTGFHPELSGRENTLLNGAILGMKRSEIDARFDEIVAFAEVERFVDTAVKHYSSGMYLRLAFAIAAHLETEILLVDEVLAVGDLAFQRKCLGKMGEVARQGRTVLFVSHNLSAIASLTARSLRLANGRLTQDGPTLDVVRDYLAESSKIGGFVSWTGDEQPGDEVLRISSLAIGDGAGSIFPSDRAISISIEFSLCATTEGLRVGFDLVSADGTLVFRSYHDDDDADPSAMKRGEYRAECEIPPNLLNQGDYFVTLRANIHAVRHIVVLDHIVTLQITNVTGVNSRYGVRPGILNPSLGWRVEAQ